jgi:pimeloyl-ACP methyl ester carboxylesterase
MPNVTVDAATAHYHDGGVPWKAGQPLVAMVHGAGCTHVVWQAQSRALAHAGYNVLVPDLPGHGASAELPALKTVEDYAGWLRRLIAAAATAQKISASPLIVVGHSLGACIAVAYGAAWPHEVNGLALVGACLEMKVNPGLLKDCLENQPRAVAFITSFGHGRTTHLSAPTWPGAWIMGADQELMLESVPAVLQRDFVGCAVWQGAAQAPKVACPTIVVSGAQDRMTPPKAGKQLADAIPGARYELLPNVGHMLPAEAPRVLLRTLQAFLAGIVSKRAA